MQKLVLGLVCGAGGPRDFDSGTGSCFLRRPYASLVKTIEVFLWWSSIPSGQQSGRKAEFSAERRCGCRFPTGALPQIETHSRTKGDA